MQTGKIGRATPRKIAETTKIQEDSKKDKKKKSSGTAKNVAPNFDVYKTEQKIQKIAAQKAEQSEQNAENSAGKMANENIKANTVLNKLV